MTSTELAQCGWVACGKAAKNLMFHSNFQINMVLCFVMENSRLNFQTLALRDINMVTEKAVERVLELYEVQTDNVLLQH